MFAIAPNYWLFLTLSCGAWFILHQGLQMIRDVQAHRRKLAARRAICNKKAPDKGL